MKTLLACIVTALITAGSVTALGLAGGATGEGPITCGPTVEGSGYSQHRIYVCTVRSMPVPGGEGFELRLPVIDAVCNAYSANASSNLPASLICDRLSLSSIKCVDGVFGSLGVVVSARRFEVDSAQRCVTRAKPPGYELTSGYTSHVFRRNP